MSIEVTNSKEEIREIVEKCTKCGLCKNLCPVFKIMREEQYSPRGMAILLNNEDYEKIVYSCCLCKACEKQCPLNLEICKAIVNCRKILVSEKKEILPYKEIIKNLNKVDNRYGKKELDT